MGRRKKTINVPEAPRPNALWEIQTEMQINGRHVKPGTELKITGWTGRYRFVKYVKTETGAEWVDVIGGPRGIEAFRSCTLEMVKRVHYKNQTYQNLAEEHKLKKKAIKEENQKNDEESN
jgi:hypothetical protein